MFFKLAARNSKRSRKEHGLFFTSLLIVIIAFYLILSLSQQDIMIFLATIESDAVKKLLTMIPLFYGMTLLILFFLVYFASKFQLEQRMHEFGVYLMMGMRRSKLFLLLLVEDFRNSLTALFLGLPIAILLSELISLITARLVGIGIIGHRFSISVSAILWTIAGFLLIKMAAFIILSGKIARKEIGMLLSPMPEGTKKQKHPLIYIASFLLGIILLSTAYIMAILGISWYHIGKMGLTLFFGFTGTLLLFFGLRSVIEFFGKKKKNQNLWIFTFRQLQENVIYENNTLAISSLLILAALCCFGSGVAITQFYGSSENHILDYTFEVENDPLIEEKISDSGLNNLFSTIFKIKTGYIQIGEDNKKTCSIDSILDLLEKEKDSEDRDVLLNNLGYVDRPHIIALTGYNKLLKQAGLPKIELEKNETAIYIDTEFLAKSRETLLNKLLKTDPEIEIAGEPYHIKGNVQTTDIVVDRSITLSFAFIVRDELFDFLTDGNYSVYLNAVLDQKTVKTKGLLNAVLETNEKLYNKAGIDCFESYLQNIGRQLFYVVAASYITIYLAIIFFVIANTANVVQFLTRQQKTGSRYKTLLKLGASYEMLCVSAKRQIDYYFGIPIFVAVISSIFGVRSLFTGLLSPRTSVDIIGFMAISIVMILLLCVTEFLYIFAVKKASNRYILSLVVFDREE